MVLKAWGLVTALTTRQLVTVLATVLFPAVPPLILYFLPDCVAEAWFVRVCLYCRICGVASVSPSFHGFHVEG